MPVIAEEASASASMDEFVNWDNVAVSPKDVDIPDNPAVDGQAALMFEDPEADEFSYWALEHYAQSKSVEDVQIEDGFQPVEIWENNDPCAHCSERGYQCKTISEGNYKGYCTSCVALRRECSFGLASGVPVPTANSFPPNPWPTLGDHPDPIHNNIVSSAPPLVDLSAQPAPASQPKLGARFSRESVRILKNWVSTHSRHPYPTEEEKEVLQRLTGLNKTQISNWLANARRRGKIPANRSTSPHVRNTWPGPNNAIDIPQSRRSGTPSPSFDRHLKQLDNNLPLQRWANSPPENEPASVTDIARAITSSSSAVSSGLTSPYFTDDGSSRSLFNGSSASSNGTSHSSDALSYGSRGSFASFVRGRRRRRRRSGAYSAGVGGTSSDEWDADRGSRRRGVVASSGKRPTADIRAVRAVTGPTSLMTPLKTYQCTFCTETFKTKHDWQRHEKSLHLSLERWVCAPQGVVAVHPDTKVPSCVFCGEAHPDEAHTELHNFSVCQERSPGDRTFYRKDHLRQHLKLVHGVKFINWAMEPWKVATPEIRSRCGFCGIAMDTWSFRTDHLAEHFKTGRTMADWKGDWGFEEPVLKMVENSIPPYLIHDERNSPLPFSASVASPESPRNAYELLRGELTFWLRNQNDASSDSPTDDAFLVEACRIILAAEIQAQTQTQNQNHVSSPSWLYDLLMSHEACQQQARLSPIRSAADSHLRALCINGKEAVFDSCPLEQSLQRFVASQAQFGLSPTNSELQAEAGCIMRQIEVELQHEMSTLHHGHDTILETQVAGFLLRQVYGSTAWLTAFRERAHLPRSEDIADEFRRPATNDPASIDATVHNNFRLEADLAGFVRQRLDAGEAFPEDEALQRQARLVIYGLEDGWNQTLADDAAWLQSFKQKHMMGQLSTNATCSGLLKPSPFFLNDTNCYRRLARELTRYVSAAMSPNNPNCHVPTDEELQHQARWILYDDDDPWNQTAADNAEWLMRFKRDAGILPAGPGLSNILSWNICQGGTGFAPPYCFPKTPMAPFGTMGAEPSPENSSHSHDDDNNNRVTVVQLQDGDYARETQYGLASATANNFLQTFTTRYAKPATVFCSRELESGLTNFVRTAVAAGAPFPDDAVLRVQAREILGTGAGDVTAADDEELLGKFKDLVRTQLASEAQQGVPTSKSTSTDLAVPRLDTGMETTFSLDLDHPLDPPLDLSSVTQTDIDNMLQDMHFEFSTEMDFMSG